MENVWMVGLLVAALAVALWVGYSALQFSSEPLPSGNGATALARPSIPEECGNLNDPQNIQHLSHHPDRYRQCYQYIDPQKFREAVGSNISEFMG